MDLKRLKGLLGEGMAKDEDWKEMVFQIGKIAWEVGMMR